MRMILNVVCVLTVAASAWLGLMSAVLHHPGFERTAIMAALFLVQSVLVLGVTNGWIVGLLWRVVSTVGAVALIWTGGSVVVHNLGSNHFEGYALIIGILLVLQGLLTPLTPSSKVHQFGN